MRTQRPAISHSVPERAACTPQRISQAPRQQRPCGRADRHYRGMPEHHVRGLEIPTVKFQHDHTGQTRQCTRRQSGSRGIHRKAAPQKQPTPERGRNREPKPCRQTGDPLRHKTLRAVVAEQEAEYGNQSHAAGRQQESGRRPPLASGDYFGEARRRHEGRKTPSAGKITARSKTLIR